MVGDYEANDVTVDSIIRARDELFDNPDDLATLDMQKVKERHDKLVDALNEPGVIAMDITYADAADGFRYRIDPNDKDINGKPKLVVKGIYKGNSDEWLYPGLVCVADKIEKGAFNISRGDFNITMLTALLMPNLDTYPDEAFENQIFMSGLIAPKLANQGYTKTREDIPIYFKTLDIRTADKPYTTIEETASLYSIGENRLRAWIKNEPEHPSILWVNTKALIKRKTFEDWLEPLNTFPY